MGLRTNVGFGLEMVGMGGLSFGKQMRFMSGVCLFRCISGVRIK